MKGNLRFIMRHDGFILIHVLFIITILYLIISFSITAYRNELYITDRQIEQVVIESLFQMGRMSYIADQKLNDEVLHEARYNFPDGKVDIFLVELNDIYRKLHFEIRLHDDHQYYSLFHLLKYDFE